jgi:hypothetical protein
MRMLDYCKECGGSSIKHICDTCGDNILDKCVGTAYDLSCGYGSQLDGNDYEFCSLICLQTFINQEVEKGVN